MSLRFFNCQVIVISSLVAHGLSTALQSVAKRCGFWPLLVGGLLLLMAGSLQASVWKATEIWDDDWDLKYSRWMEANWKTDFFMNPKRPAFYKLAHDCGDAAYFARIAFAWEHKLPFVIHDPLHRGKLLKQSMRDFDKIGDPVKRLRAFMNFIAGRVSTSSLPNDTYPVALKAIRPGDLYVSPGNHNYQIVSISDTGVPTLLSSTTPRKPRYLLQFQGFPMFVPSDEKNMRDGYRRFRRPQDINKPMKALPDFSNEQYKMAKAAGYQFSRFSNALAVMLGQRPESSRETIERMVGEMCNLVNERRDYVNEGFEYLQQMRKQGRRCMNKEEYYHYSTTSRDMRLGAFFNQNRRAMNRLMMTGADPAMIEILRGIFQPDAPSPEVDAKLRLLCPVESGVPYYPVVDLRDIWLAIWTGQLVSDPHAPLAHRWGIAGTAWEPDCPVYED